MHRHYLLYECHLVGSSVMANSMRSGADYVSPLEFTWLASPYDFGCWCASPLHRFDAFPLQRYDIYDALIANSRCYYLPF